MTADINQEAELRHYLVDYTVMNIGSASEELDLDPSPHDLGVGCHEAMGGRFPRMICGSDALWQFVFEGRSAIKEIPPDRWQPFDDGSPKVAACTGPDEAWGSFFAEINAFDAEFCEISPGVRRSAPSRDIGYARTSDESTQALRRWLAASKVAAPHRTCRQPGWCP